MEHLKRTGGTRLGWNNIYKDTFILMADKALAISEEIAWNSTIVYSLRNLEQRLYCKLKEDRVEEVLEGLALTYSFHKTVLPNKEELKRIVDKSYADEVAYFEGKDITGRFLKEHDSDGSDWQSLAYSNLLSHVLGYISCAVQRENKACFTLEEAVAKVKHDKQEQEEALALLFSAVMISLEEDAMAKEYLNTPDEELAQEYLDRIPFPQAEQGKRLFLRIKETVEKTIALYMNPSVLP